MNKKILICTPIKEIIPKKRNEVLIYPAQLVSNSIHSFTKEYKFKESNHPWKNKSILQRDYNYVLSLYEKSLKLLCKDLNNYHKKNFSVEFWRIFIGPWISIFYFIIFERYKSLEQCFKLNRINQINIIDYKNSEKFIPTDMKEFIYSVNKDSWNQNMYQEIIKIFFKNNSNYKIFKEKEKVTQQIYRNNFSFFKKIISNITNLLPFNKFYKYFISSSYLGAFNESKLSLKLCQLPIFYKEKQIDKQFEINYKLRAELASKTRFTKNFENKIFALAIKMIPAVFLENFSSLEKQIKKKNIPSEPKIIFSSNFLWYDSFSMFYTAFNKEKGSKLFYGQHGGCYGISKLNFAENHELKIADKYLSWGWSQISQKSKIKKIGIISNLNKFKRVTYPKNLLILFRPIYKYFFSVESGIGTEQFEDYSKYCQNLFNNLNSNIKDQTVLRPHLNFYKEELFCKFKHTKKLRFSNRSFNEDCNNARLIINTCNSTPFLQTFSLNFPSIVLWNKANNPIKKQAHKYIDFLSKNNLLFYDGKKASKFVNKIWKSGIDKWWYGDKNQKIVKKFTNTFCKKNNNIILEIKDLMLKENN